MASLKKRGPVYYIQFYVGTRQRRITAPEQDADCYRADGVRHALRTTKTSAHTAPHHLRDAFGQFHERGLASRGPGPWRPIVRATGSFTGEHLHDTTAGITIGSREGSHRLALILDLGGRWDLYSREVPPASFTGPRSTMAEL